MDDATLALSNLADIAKLLKSLEGVNAVDPFGDLLKNIKKAINDIVAGLLSPISETVGNVYTRIKGIVGDVVEGMKESLANITETVKGYIDGFVSTIEEKVTGVIDAVTENVTGVIDGVSQWLEDAIDNIRNKIQEITNNIKTLGQNIIDGVSNFVKEKIDLVRDWIDNGIETIKTRITETVNDIGEWIGQIIDAFTNAIYEFIQNAKDFIGDVYDRVKAWFDGIINHLKNVYETTKTTVEGKLTEMVSWLKEMWAQFQAFFRGAVASAVSWVGENIMPNILAATEGARLLLEPITNIWGMIEDGNFAGAFDKLDEVFTTFGGPAPFQVIESLLGMLAYIQEAVKIKFAGMHLSAQKNAVISLAMEGVGLPDMANAVYRGLTNETAYFENAKIQGIAPNRAGLVLEAGRPLPTPGQIQEGYLRGEISAERHDYLLSAYGFSKENIDLFKALYQIIPTPTDLIRMAVREVFTPEVVQEFGQMEDFPPAFGNWAKKIGLSEEWAKNYWAAHWDLPSPQMGFEMLHRGVIDQPTLELLLRSLDVMPYWREKLVQISYAPLTRVDIRRMYQVGVLDVDQVKRAYLDIGYDEEKASWLTEFTIRYSAPEDTSELTEFRQMARSVYSQAYRKNIISLEEYRTFLLDMKYHENDVQMLIELDNYAIEDNQKQFDIGDYKKDYRKLALSAFDGGLISYDEASMILSDLGYTDSELTLEFSLLEYNRQLKLRDLLVSRLHSQYVDYLIDLTDLHTIGNMFGFTQYELARMQEEWDIEKNFRVKRPPISDLKKFHAAGLLTNDQYLEELRGIGYHEKYISLYEATLAIREE